LILEIDAGNSRIKWRLVPGTEADDSELLADVADDEEALFTQLANLSGIEAVRLSCVRGAESIEAVKAWAAEALGLAVQVATVTRSCAGVRNQYEELSRLGVDRWLAIIAAYNRAQSACVIVDAGTAITVDVLAKDGEHQGGYILPGRRLMARAIEDNTRIRLLEEPKPSTALGHGTEAAVCNGIYASQIALLQSVIADTLTASGRLKLFLAGGDAVVLSELLGSSEEYESEIVSDLVLDGLALVCTEDSNR